MEQNRIREMIRMDRMEMIRRQLQLANKHTKKVVVDEEESEEEDAIMDETEAGEEECFPPPPLLLHRGLIMGDENELYNRNKEGSAERDVEKEMIRMDMVEIIRRQWQLAKKHTNKIVPEDDEEEEEEEEEGDEDEVINL